MTPQQETAAPASAELEITLQRLEYELRLAFETFKALADTDQGARAFEAFEVAADAWERCEQIVVPRPVETPDGGG